MQEAVQKGADTTRNQRFPALKLPNIKAQAEEGVFLQCYPNLRTSRSPASLYKVGAKGTMVFDDSMPDMHSKVALGLKQKYAGHRYQSTSNMIHKTSVTQSTSSVQQAEALNTTNVSGSGSPVSGFDEKQRHVRRLELNFSMGGPL